MFMYDTETQTIMAIYLFISHLLVCMFVIDTLNARVLVTECSSSSVRGRNEDD